MTPAQAVVLYVWQKDETVCLAQLACGFPSELLLSGLLPAPTSPLPGCPSMSLQYQQLGYNSYFAVQCSRHLRAHAHKDIIMTKAWLGLLHHPPLSDTWSIGAGQLSGADAACHWGQYPAG